MKVTFIIAVSNVKSYMEGNEIHKKRSFLIKMLLAEGVKVLLHTKWHKAAKRCS